MCSSDLPNFGQPNLTLFNSQSAADLAAGITTYRADVARIVDTDTTSRQLQFGVKLEF